MKIGLEFEGVIRNYKTGEIQRWSKIPVEARAGIKKLMFVRRKRIDPCDRYDALAEVRTPPIENPTAEKLITELFSEMENATKCFMAHGYFIQWLEQPIPQELHDEIRHDKNLADPDGKKDKVTYTIKDGMRANYVSEGNLFRGGGLHINMSCVPECFAEGLVTQLHRNLQPLREKYKFQSHYRNNLLYRVKETAVCNDYLKIDQHKFETVVEYMSHGFNVPALDGWAEVWAKQSNEGYVTEPAFAWARIVCYTFQRFMCDAKGLR